ncbi:hypothetical protein KFE25_010368 [Diacronema lutheri]|uniref:FHA domain-containing protein n=1 Tax=Diacronema lutheri TaxID=2081491 RepID=A0A8J5X9W2_DIALT|nr:hypothetical protein KFE25_010368 [Diacronema lutheri]
MATIGLVAVSCNKRHADLVPGSRVGRRAGVDVCIDDSRISSVHAALTHDGRITDTSTNGVFVNGARMSRGETRALAHGDVVTLCATTLAHARHVFGDTFAAWRVVLADPCAAGRVAGPPASDSSARHTAESARALVGAPRGPGHGRAPDPACTAAPVSFPSRSATDAALAPESAAVPSQLVGSAAPQAVEPDAGAPRGDGAPLLVETVPKRTAPPALDAPPHTHIDPPSDPSALDETADEFRFSPDDDERVRPSSGGGAASALGKRGATLALVRPAAARPRTAGGGDARRASTPCSDAGPKAKAHTSLDSIFAHMRSGRAA